jgi:lipoprotein-releasing system permease protein
MPFEWFVALRYIRVAKGQTVLIVSAVAVGVGVIVFLSALIGGLQASLIDKTLGSQPHVTLHEPREAARLLVASTPTLVITSRTQPAPQRLRSINQWPVVLGELERTSGVIAASPMVTGAGFAIRSDAKSPVLIRGVVPERFIQIIDIPKKIILGRFETGGGYVSIGSTLASDLGVGVGDKLRLLTTEGVDDVVTIAGVFRLGNEAVDRTWVITSLRHAQSLYALPGGATTIEFKVDDVFEAERVATGVHALTLLDADSWMKLNAELLTALSAQSSSKSMIQFFVVLTVALGIASVLIVSVVQKTREIGILRALGTPRKRVLRIFLIQGGVLGVIGALIGCGLGALLSKLFEQIAANPDGSPKFPVILNLQLFASTTLLATCVGLLAAVIPARRASQLDPVKSINNG